MPDQNPSNLPKCNPGTTPKRLTAARGGRLISAAANLYDRFVKLRGCPREIAKGFALGLFVGMSPTMGFQMLIAVPLAALFRWNKLAAAAGVWISNPVTAPVLYGTTYLLGAKILGMTGHPMSSGFAEGWSVLRMLAKAPQLFWAMTIGGLILGIPISLAGYYLSLSAVRKYRAEIQQKIAAGKQKLASRRSGRKSKKNKRHRN